MRLASTLVQFNLYTHPPTLSPMTALATHGETANLTLNCSPLVYSSCQRYDNGIEAYMLANNEV